MKNTCVFEGFEGYPGHNVIWIWMDLDESGCPWMNLDVTGLARAGAPILTLLGGDEGEAFQGTV